MSSWSSTPSTLTTIEVRLRGVAAGTAIPHHISRHSHHKARPETPPQPPPAPTGIDYARLIDTAHHAELARGVNYTALTSTAFAGELPGQLDLLTGGEIIGGEITGSEITGGGVGS